MPIRVPAHRTQAARKFVPAGDNLGGFDVHPAGHSLAVDVRGKLFTFGLWEGAVRQLGLADGARHRHGQWLADGATVVAVSDETGEERVQSWKDGATRALPWDIGRAVAMRAAPKGTLVAVANHRNEVLVRRRRERGGRRDRPQRARPHRGPRVVARWRSGSRIRRGPMRGIRRSSSTASPAKTATLVTQPEFRDYSPSFDPAGKYLYFLSIRTFDPVYDAVQFELHRSRAPRGRISSRSQAEARRRSIPR